MATEIELSNNGNVSERIAVGKDGLVLIRYLLEKSTDGKEIHVVWKEHHRFTLSSVGLAAVRRMAVEVLDPERNITNEFAMERLQQRFRFPESEHMPDGTGGGGRETWERIAKISCERAASEGRLTHTHVFDEETAEAMSETDPAKLRAELVQVGAVVCKWIGDIDSRRER